jgi:hypothetical protein
MFKNSDNDNDTEAGHTCNGRVFREVHLANLFKKNYGEEGFYSGEEVELMDKEHSELSRAKEVKAKEIHRGEPETSKTVQIIEVSIVIPSIDLVVLRNQSNLGHQRVQSTINGSPPHSQSGTLARSMVDEMRLPIFRGDGSEDPDQHCFLCEAVWNIKNFANKVVKRTQFSTTLRDRALSWYMKLVQGIAQPKPLNQIKNVLIAEFKKPKSESQCIIDMKEIKKKVSKPVWEFD